MWLLSVWQLAAQPEMAGRLSLSECIAFGLKNNPEYQSSQYLVEETKAKVKEAFSGYYPVVNLNSDADEYSRNNDSQGYNNISTGVTLSYGIFQGFKTKSSYGASQDNHKAIIHQHETNKQILIFNIIQAYYKTLQSERILRSAEEAVKNSSLHLEFAWAKQKAGMATRSDILKSKVELSNAELNRIKAANILLAAKGNFNQLLGLQSNYKIELVDDLSTINELAVQSYDSLLNEAVNSRPEVKRYQSLLNAQEKYI